jgi:hypothetical protein
MRRSVLSFGWREGVSRGEGSAAPCSGPRCRRPFRGISAVHRRRRVVFLNCTPFRRIALIIGFDCVELFMIHCGRGEAESDAGKPHCPVGGGCFVSSHWRFDASTRESCSGEPHVLLVLCASGVGHMPSVRCALESCPMVDWVLDGDRPDEIDMFCFHVGCLSMLGVLSSSNV